MIAYCYGVWNEFLNFIGRRSGLAHWLLFIAALACCMFMGREIRKKLFFPSVLVLLFFFNPLFYAAVGTKFLSGVYWRLLWMLPISFLIAYVLTYLAFKIRKNMLRAAVIAVCFLCIAASGERIFTEETYREKENAYELPQAVLEICDYVKRNLEDWKETIIVPNEMLCYVRQYSSAVGLFYGRNAGGFITNIEAEEAAVHAEMSKEEPDMGIITDIGKNRDCRYLVFDTEFHRIPEDLTEYGYEKVHVVEGRYVIYRIFEECRPRKAMT